MIKVVRGNPTPEELAAALAGGFGARLLRLRLGLSGRLHRGEVDDAAHGHVSGLHGYILPLPRA